MQQRMRVSHSNASLGYVGCCKGNPSPFSSSDRSPRGPLEMAFPQRPLGADPLMSVSYVSP
jgi:hypothetical protein